MSWHEAFADQYDEWSARMTADIPFYVELAREAKGPLFELAIGNGRVAIPVAQGDGQAGERRRLVAGDAGAGAGERRRSRGRARAARGRHARLHGRQSPRR